MSNSQVDWAFARTVAERVAGREPFGESYHLESLEAELKELTAQAERLVEAETGLVSQAGPARARVTDRIGWVDANLASFQRLMGPLFDRLSKDSDGGDDSSDANDGDGAGPHANGAATNGADVNGADANGNDAAAAANGSEADAGNGNGNDATAATDGAGSAADSAARIAADAARKVGSALNQVGSTVSQTVGPKIAGAQVGAMLGWMSSRVLGQYDLLIAEDDSPEDQDWVYYVGPNLLSLEKRYGFPPEEFRLWIAVHECTHRAQFTGVPWLRPYFLSLVNELIDSVDPDLKRITDAMGDIVTDIRNGDRDKIAEGGLQMLLATPEQRETMKKVSGLMSLLEGHGDIIMDRATKDLIPSQARFARVMANRRRNAGPVTRLVQKLTGLEAKLAQYEEGENFVKAVEAAGGRELFDRVWTGPEALPTIDEIRDPDLWIERVGAPAQA
ncbi:MAG: zinc-dependent metalloprotease [Actinomycetota bacterium]